MSKRIYVTNLPDFVDEEVLFRIFSELGAPDELKLVREKDTGKSRGTAFITLGSQTQARQAIAKLNGVKFCDHVVLEAGEAEPRLVVVRGAEKAEVTSRKRRQL